MQTVIFGHPSLRVGKDLKEDMVSELDLEG